MSYRHGTSVILTDAHGDAYEGKLHLPPYWVYARHGKYEVQPSTGGGYGVHTVRLEDGKLFRTEGRLSSPAGRLPEGT